MARDAGEPSAKRAKVDKTDEEEDALVRRREELVLMDANARANVRAMRKESMVREAEETAKQLKREAKCKKSKRRLWMKKARAEGERLVREAKERFILESDRTLREARLLPEGFGQELRTVCAALEAKNEKKLTRLPPELWEKILDDENLHQNDTLALASTCRFFREKQKDFGWEMETILVLHHFGALLTLWESGKVACQSLDWFRWVCGTMEIQWGFEVWDDERVKGAVYQGDLVNFAAFQGSVEILRWLIEEERCELNQKTGRWAGLGGSVKVLAYLWERGYEFTEGACAGAVSGGRLEALKFLKGLDTPCPWDGRTCAYAASEGYLEVLKWLRSQDPPCPWDEQTCSWAAHGGHLDVLKWVRDQDPPCPWDEGTCTWAAHGGHLDVLKWARSQDPPCPWDEGTCPFAAQGGHLDVLKWARDQDPPCPWDKSTCDSAALGGHLEVLKFLRAENPPCPWNEGTCALAAEGGHLDVLKWARSQDPPCPWSREECREQALRNGHRHIVKWILRVAVEAWRRATSFYIRGSSKRSDLGN
ncbi:putative ankyrin repeat protein [Chloropicon roscoffensis]|uniref:Ankyrin repeat protein n=1 Tax=Chloropicon roscoffensis TaxID=1461544 RepID=A0AAX4P4S4_9CHLO